MISWLKKLLIPAGMLLGVFLIYFAGARFLAAPTREISFAEFGQYQTATTTAPAGAVRALNYPAPSFELPDLQNKKIKLSDFLKKAVVLVFWTAWNPAARDQIAILESYYQKNKDRGDLAMIAVNSQENKSVVSSFLKRGEYQLPVLLDEEGKTGEAYNINILPAFYFIGKDGRVKDEYIGVLNENELEERAAKLSAE